MLVLDFINVGNGDSTLIRDMENGVQRFAVLVDCGHDSLIRDDHSAELDPRSQRIYAGDFLKKQGVTHLDMVVLTHFHRDHIGGLGRVLEAATVDKLIATYIPPADSQDLEPDKDMEFPKAARNLLRCVNIYATALREHSGRVRELVELPGDKLESYQLTDDLSMDIVCGEPALYPRQKEVYDAAFRGERDRYALMHWGKCMNVSSLRQRLHYHGKEIVLGGDAYAVVWDNDTLAPCDILKVPHHACLSSTTRKMVDMLRPRTAVQKLLWDKQEENIPLFGYGSKTYMIGMTDAAIEICGGSLQRETYLAIKKIITDLAFHELEIFPGVRETLETLSERYRLVLATKGDAVEQMAKVDASGLALLFSAIEVMKNKEEGDYLTLCSKFGIRPSEMTMVGNSVRSDILPVIGIGGRAIYIPHEIVWVHEIAELPESDLLVKADEFCNLTQLLMA